MENKIEILKTAEDYINSLKKGIMEAVYCYQSGEESKGSSLVIEICDGIDWLVKALTLSYEIVNSEKNLNELNGKLTEVVEAFENEDFILIGDLLEYEVIPILEDTQSSIKKYRKI